jgi:hypothetical protein
MHDKTFDVSGAITFWSLQPTSLQAVTDLFGRMGFADCVPNPRTDISALEHSIKEVYGTKNRTVVSRKQPKRHGVELVDIERNPDRNHYTTNFGAKVVSGRVKADYGYADEYKLTEAYLKQKAKLTSAALGQALVKVLAKLDAMMDLKPSGGVYYVPEHHLDAWRRLAEGVEQCQEGNVVSTVRAAMDEGTARAVRDALTRQVQEEATKLVEDVSKGTLRGDGVRRRAEQAQALIERVDLYSAILDDGLTGLKNVAALAKQTAMAYVMQDMAGAFAAA